MLYMTYAGAAPTLFSCGSYKFGEKETAKERCAHLSQMLGQRDTLDFLRFFKFIRNLL
jgi:hypothetical protein